MNDQHFYVTAEQCEDGRFGFRIHNPERLQTIYIRQFIKQVEAAGGVEVAAGATEVGYGSVPPMVGCKSFTIFPKSDAGVVK